MTSISCRDLDFSSLVDFCVATKFLCRNTVYVASHFDSRSDNFLWSPSVCVATSISCRDLAVFPFTEFGVATTIPCHNTISVVSQFDPWSQPPFHVATSFLGFCLHASCNSKLLICLFSCCDMGLRLRPGSFVSYCNSYRDLKSMSRPFFLPILSQPHFLVTIVSTQFSFFFWSRPRKCVATEWCLSHLILVAVAQT